MEKIVMTTCNVSGLLTRESLEEWIAGKQFNEIYDLATLCTEYITMNESLGTYWKTLEYEFFPISFFTNKANIDKMNNIQRRNAYKHLNSLFYTNNKLLNTVKYLSNVVISSYNNDDLNNRDDYPAVSALYISNIGQYYNGIGNYSKAATYHINSLIVKVNNLFSLLDDSCKKYKDEFFSIIGKTDISSLSIDDINLQCHNGYWERMEHVVSKQCTSILEKENQEDKEAVLHAIEDRWMRIAVSYRTLGADMNGTDEKSVDYQKLIALGGQCMFIAVNMLNSSIVQGVPRERLMTISRAIEINCRRDYIDDYELEKMMKWADYGTKLYIDNSQFMGEYEGKKLRNSLYSLYKKSESESVKKDYELLNRNLGRS